MGLHGATLGKDVDKKWAGYIYEPCELTNGAGAGIWAMGMPGFTFGDQLNAKWARYMCEAVGCQKGVLAEYGP